MRVASVEHRQKKAPWFCEAVVCGLTPLFAVDPLLQPLGCLLETQETYRCGIAQEQRVLDQLQAQTWGVWLHEAEDGTRYVVLPYGTLAVDGWSWTVQVQPTLLLSSE